MVHAKPIKHLSTLNRKTDNPEAYIFTGDAKIDAVDIQQFIYNKESYVECTNLATDKIRTRDELGAVSWINIYGLHDVNSIASLCAPLGIHPLVIQDILDVHQRPKFQEYENYYFLTLKSIVQSGNEMFTEQISFIFDTHFLISFQERKAGLFEHLRIRLREKVGVLRERTADYLLYAMLESILDNYFNSLHKIDQEVANLDFTDWQKELHPDTLKAIENHKKFVQFIKKSILPIKEFAQMVEQAGCACVGKKNIKYFVEIKDLCLTLMDSCDIILASLESASNMFFSMQGRRLNQIMKTLTIVATLFIPLTFIAGIYGMNFSNMPELTWKYGYVGIWIVFLVSFLGMLWFFKKKKWF